MTIQLQVPRPEEWDRWFDQLERAFGGGKEEPERRDLWRSLTEPERFLAALDGDEMVGTAGAFSFRLSVPGGALVSVAGVTGVGVSGTHRRRGILTSMMRRQLDDVREWGEPIAVLTASEPEIYGRFGYGAATMKLEATVDTARVRLPQVPAGTDEVRVRYADPAASLEACEAVYAQRVTGRPGMLARRPGWERRGLLDPPGERAGASPLQCVLAERGGKVVGYARYAVKREWNAAGPAFEVRVRDVEALDPAAYAALLRFLFGLDLTSSVRLPSLPVDDPLPHMVSDPRRCGLRTEDSLYLRLVEVGTALEARAYLTPVDVVFDVEDAFCPWNEGRWRLMTDAQGAAVCKRTEDPADLALSVRELGAAYLGGVSLVSLAGAGRVRELRAGALAETSVTFGSAVAPWLPHGF
jgi:predicted acetyltransferase